MNHFAVLMHFLEDRSKFLQEINQGKKLEKIIFSLLISSSIFFAVYGSIMGSFQGGLQVLSSAIKLPALYLLTLIICLPTLYFYEVISGSKRSFGQYFAILLASMSVISVMLFGFAPVTLFFRLSISNYAFFQLLNVIILAITGLIGIKFLYQSMLAIADEETELPQQRKFVLRAWLTLYGLVGSQLGWTLRPFFGDPNQPFALFRQLESNFYVHLLEIIGEILGLR